MLGVKTVPLQTYARDRFYPSPELCEKLITDKTKAIVLVSPNNPVRSTDSVARTLSDNFDRLAQFIRRP